MRVMLNPRSRESWDRVPDRLSPGYAHGDAKSASAVQATSSALQWLGKAFPKIMWVIIIFRVTGYCAKNYFMINRKAMKRITTYAGKHAAFSAELKTAEKLKATKDK